MFMLKTKPERFCTASCLMVVKWNSFKDCHIHSIDDAFITSTRGKVSLYSLSTANLKAIFQSVEVAEASKTLPLDFNAF